MKWLNAFSILLQFISFWLAAPELIGDVSLKRLNAFLQKFVSNISMIFLALLILAFSITIGINGIIKGINYSATGVTTEEMWAYYINLGIAGFLYLIFMIFFKKIKLWLDKHLSAPLVNKFTYSDSFRRNSLLIGALLFTFGFVIQFMLILLQP